LDEIGKDDDGVVFGVVGTPVAEGPSEEGCDGSSGVAVGVETGVGFGALWNVDEEIEPAGAGL